TGEKVSSDELGGARMHCATSGLGDALVSSEPEALDWIRRYLDFMPERAGAALPAHTGRNPDRPGSSLGEMVPEDGGKPFPMLDLIDEVVDGGPRLEMKALFAREMLTTLVR